MPAKRQRSGGSAALPRRHCEWAVDSVAKAGTLSIIGVYPPPLESFPIGKVMNKNLTVRTGNCNHRKYLPRLVELVRSGVMRPEQFFTQQVPFTSAMDAYHHFDRHESGWLKSEARARQSAQSRMKHMARPEPFGPRRARFAF